MNRSPAPIARLGLLQREEIADERPRIQVRRDLAEERQRVVVIVMKRNTLSGAEYEEHVEVAEVELREVEIRWQGAAASCR